MYRDPGTKLRSVPLTPEIDAKVKELAEMRGITQTQMLRTIIEEGVKREWQAMKDPRFNDDHYEIDEEIANFYALAYGEKE